MNKQILDQLKSHMRKELKARKKQSSKEPCSSIRYECKIGDNGYEKAMRDAFEFLEKYKDD